MMKKNKALILSNEPRIYSGVTEALAREDIQIDYGDSLEIGLARVQDAIYAVLFLDESICRPNPAKAISSLGKATPNTRIVYICAAEGPDAVASALAAGALAQLPKPLDPFDVVQTFRRVLTLTPRLAVAMTGNEQQPAVKLGRIISVLGASDNVGKTTIAVNLAAALAMREGVAVCIADLDLQFGDVCWYLGVEPKSTVAALAGGQIGGAAVREHLTAWRDGVDLLAAPPRPELAETVAPEIVQAVLQQLREQYTYVVVDTASGFNEVNLALIEATDTILLVGVLDSIATVKNIKICLDTLQKLGRSAEDIKLVLNRDGAKPSIDRHEVEQALGRGFDTSLPNDFKTLTEAIAAKDTFIANRQAKGLSAAIFKLAETLNVRTTEPAKSSLSFADRLKKLFSKT